MAEPDEAPPTALAAAVRVLPPVLEGSIVLVSDTLDLPAANGNDEPFIVNLRDAIAGVNGHDRFVLLVVPPKGRVEVFGPDDLVDALQRVNLAADADNRVPPDARPGADEGWPRDGIPLAAHGLV
jgi:hypothetical protein